LVPAFLSFATFGSGPWSSQCASETGLSSVCPSSRFDSPPLSHFPHGKGRRSTPQSPMRPGGKQRGRKLRRTAQVDRRSVQRRCSARDVSTNAFSVLFTNTPTEDSSQPNQAQRLTKVAEIFSNFCRGPIAQPPADLPPRHHLADIANYITVKNDRGTNRLRLTGRIVAQNWECRETASSPKQSRPAIHGVTCSL